MVDFKDPYQGAFRGFAVHPGAGFQMRMSGGTPRTLMPGVAGHCHRAYARLRAVYDQESNIDQLIFRMSFQRLGNDRLVIAVLRHRGAHLLE